MFCFLCPLRWSWQNCRIWWWDWWQRGMTGTAGTPALCPAQAQWTPTCFLSGRSTLGLSAKRTFRQSPTLSVEQVQEQLQPELFCNRNEEVLGFSWRLTLLSLQKPWRSSPCRSPQQVLNRLSCFHLDQPTLIPNHWGQKRAAQLSRSCSCSRRSKTPREQQDHPLSLERTPASLFSTGLMNRMKWRSLSFEVCVCVSGCERTDLWAILNSSFSCKHIISRNTYRIGSELSGFVPVTLERPFCSFVDVTVCKNDWLDLQKRRIPLLNTSCDFHPSSHVLSYI